MNSMESYQIIAAAGVTPEGEPEGEIGDLGETIIIAADGETRIEKAPAPEAEDSRPALTFMEGFNEDLDVSAARAEKVDKIIRTVPEVGLLRELSALVMETQDTPSVLLDRYTEVKLFDDKQNDRVAGVLQKLGEKSFREVFIGALREDDEEARKATLGGLKIFGLRLVRAVGPTTREEWENTEFQASGKDALRRLGERIYVEASLFAMERPGLSKSLPDNNKKQLEVDRERLEALIKEHYVGLPDISEDFRDRMQDFLYAQKMRRQEPIDLTDVLPQEERELAKLLQEDRDKPAEAKSEEELEALAAEKRAVRVQRNNKEERALVKKLADPGSLLAIEKIHEIYKTALDLRGGYAENKLDELRVIAKDKFVGGHGLEQFVDYLPYMMQQTQLEIDAAKGKQSTLGAGKAFRFFANPIGNFLTNRRLLGLQEALISPNDVPKARRKLEQQMAEVFEQMASQAQYPGEKQFWETHADFLKLNEKLRVRADLERQGAAPNEGPGRLKKAGQWAWNSRGVAFGGRQLRKLPYVSGVEGFVKKVGKRAARSFKVVDQERKDQLVKQFLKRPRTVRYEYFNKGEKKVIKTIEVTSEEAAQMQRNIVDNDVHRRVSEELNDQGLELADFGFAENYPSQIKKAAGWLGRAWKWLSGKA